MADALGLLDRLIGEGLDGALRLAWVDGRPGAGVGDLLRELAVGWPAAAVVLPGESLRRKDSGWWWDELTRSVHVSGGESDEPVLLLIDAAEQVDPDSLDRLVRVCRRPRRAKVVVVLSTTDPDSYAAHRWGSLVGSVGHGTILLRHTAHLIPAQRLSPVLAADCDLALDPEPDPPGAAAAAWAARVGVLLEQAPDQPEEVLPTLVEVLRAAPEGADTGTLVDAVEQGVRAAVALGRQPEAMAYVRELLPVAPRLVVMQSVPLYLHRQEKAALQALDQLLLEQPDAVSVRTRRAALEIFCGRPGAAVADAGRAARGYCAEDPGGAAADWAHALAQLLVGRHRAADRSARAGLRAALRHGETHVVPWLEAVRALVQVATGELDGGRVAIERLWHAEAVDTNLAATAVVGSARAAAALEAGDLDVVLDTARRVGALDQGWGTPRTGFPGCSSSAVQALLDAGDLPAARAVLDAVLHAADPVELELLRVEVALAARESPDVLPACAQVQSVAVQARWETASATALVRQGRLEEARSRALGAEALAERSGSCRLLSSARRVLEQTVLARSQRPALEVALLAAEGLTNRQIAQRVHLSPHTVDYHLRVVFRQLGITSRAHLDRAALDALT